MHLSCESIVGSHQSSQITVSESSQSILHLPPFLVQDTFSTQGVEMFSILQMHFSLSHKSLHEISLAIAMQSAFGTHFPSHFPMASAHVSYCLQLNVFLILHMHLSDEILKGSQLFSQYASAVSVQFLTHVPRLAHSCACSHFGIAHSQASSCLQSFVHVIVLLSSQSLTHLPPSVLHLSVSPQQNGHGAFKIMSPLLSTFHVGVQIS
mmetsp:Transcript_7366/g.8558  ORF Transcript_7366/g.8558 Transcript_7366/m.8558 type:complete len:208 (-) Transcript_7366:161-784(-)